jgi:hypothetical protein
MKELLNNVLAQLRIARINVNPRSLRKQITLFEIDDSQEVEFNGLKSTVTYHEHLYTFYLPCKRLVDEMMEKTLKLTPLRRSKLTPFRRSKLTPLKKC